MKTSGKVDSYIEMLPEKEQQMAAYIRELIFNVVPNAEERYSFKLPFYHFHGMFCYINYLKKGGGIELVFCRGKDLLLAFPELETKGRAMVAGITLHSLKEINVSFLQSLIAAAAAWQTETHVAQKPFIQQKCKPAKKKI